MKTGNQAGQRHMGASSGPYHHKNTMSSGGGKNAKGIMGKGSPAGGSPSGTMGKHQRTGSGH